MNSTGEKKTNPWKQMLPGILVSLIIIVILVYSVDFQDLVSSFKNVSIELIVIVFGLQSAAFIFRALAWKITL